jgi:hypothetical protein
MIPHPDQARTRSATTILRRRAAAVEHVSRSPGSAPASAIHLTHKYGSAQALIMRAARAA